MAAPVIVQTCWRGQRTPAAVDAQLLHLDCDHALGYAGYGRGLYLLWFGREDRDAPGLWVIEHDVAVDPADVEMMAAQIERYPDCVVAAAYTCWPVSTHLDYPLTLPRFDRGYWRFGLGCTYLPAALLDAAGEALAHWDYPSLDAELSIAAREAGIGFHRAVGARPKHLHY